MTILTQAIRKNLTLRKLYLRTNKFLMCLIIARARALYRVRVRDFLKTNTLQMDEIINIFDKFGFSVALAITLLIFAYRIVNRYIKYLQDTIKDLCNVIQSNTEIYKKLYDYLTKN